MPELSELHKLKIRRSSQMTGLVGYRVKALNEIERREKLIAELDTQIKNLEKEQDNA